MHPPKPELILNLQSSDQSTPDVKHLKLDQLKKSSKVRNAALGSAIAKVKLSETDIQNTDGSNPRLPPFAFSGDEKHVGTKSLNELESIQSVTTTLSPTTAFEDARVADSLAEMDRMEAEQKQAASWQSARAIGAAGAQIPPMESVEESVDTVIELGSTSTVASTEAPSGTESLDPIAEYNRKIVESGRNIVPVRLFFDTDPHPEMLLEESFKRSISSPAETDKTTKLVASAEKTFDGLAVTNQFQTTSKQALLLSSESPTPSTIAITKSSVPVREQILITGVTKGVEDIDGSGWPPTTTIGSAIDAQEELLTAGLHTGEVGKTTQALNLKPKPIVSGEVIESSVTTFEANPPATTKFTGTASSETHPTSSGSGTSLSGSEFDLSSNTDAFLPTNIGEQSTNVATNPSSSSITTAIKTIPVAVSESKIDSEVTTALRSAFDERSSTTIDITSTTLDLKTPVDITTDAERTFESLKSKSGTKAPKKSAARTTVSDSLSKIPDSEQSTKITTGAISTGESSEIAKASQMASDSQSLEAGASSPISAEGTSSDFAGNGATHSATFDGKFSSLDTDISSTSHGMTSDLATNPQTISDTKSSVTLTNPATFEPEFASDTDNTDAQSPATFDAISTVIATDAQSSPRTSSSKVASTDEPTTFSEDITRFEKMIEVRPAPSTQKAEEPLEMIALPKEEQADEGLSTSSTPATITEEVHSEATVTVPIPVEAATRPTTGGPSDSLPTMLTMPSLSALSSFSSLSTPVEIATRPRQTPKPAVVAPVPSLPLVKKSSGIIGSRNVPKKPRRKILRGRKVDISDSDREILAKTTRTRPVSAAERPLYIKQRLGNPTIQRKSVHALRSGIQRPVSVNESASQIMLRKVHPDQQIYHRTFKIDRPKRMRVRAKNQRGIAARQGGSATNVRSSFPIPGSSHLNSASQLIITSPLPPKSPPTLKRVAVQPYSLSRQPIFGASHQQVPAVQHSLSPAPRADQAAITLDQLPQRLSIASPLTRTMMPPLNAAVKLPLTKIEPTSETVQRLSDWDRIRAEFLRIKRQQRKLRRKQREERARAAAGVKTLTGDRVPSAVGERTHNHRHPHNGEIARGVVWREIDSNRDSRALRVDVDPSRRTIDRDAIVNL
ncbi:unnamed protein product [Cylicocyclus nassatus]|uniref:Uncharacterized protein n=1 Tax=Cylicocyclus nassatus TaxID=53992 RepID=A0AA36MDQ4_CYLNA|nr:unnamed protein product [Cylicocyclus nassatus]